MTFQQYAEEWRRTKTHGYATAERLERGLRNHCYPVLGDVPMAVLGRRVSLMRDWIAGLPLQPNGARLLISDVSAIFQAAIDDRLIARNPLKARSVEKPKEVRSPVVAWSAGQVEAVARELPERMAAMVWLGGVTGMRQGELFGLALEDIDWLRRMVRVEAQAIQLGSGAAFGPVKNKKTRTVPVARNIMPLLGRHIELFKPAEVTLRWSQRGQRLDGKPVTRTLLFADPRGVPYNKQTVNRQWIKSWHAAGVPDLGRANGMHVLRHTAASHWLSGGLNPAKVADYLGDTVAMVWKTYAHYMPADHDLGRAIMDGFLDPSGEASGASERPQNAFGGV